MRNVVVVDANVAIAANGRDTHADLRCRRACIRRLRSVISGERVGLDEMGLIFAEYKTHLHYSGEPGAGDVFFKHLHNHQYHRDYVCRIAITPDREDRGFAELPSNRLDRSDRKFLAVAKKAHASILNALDSDWEENAGLLSDLGVALEQICPKYASK